MRISTKYLVAITIATCMLTAEAAAQRRGGGGFRGGGGGFRGGGMSRGSARMNVTRPSRPSNVGRGDIGRSNINRPDIGRGDINRGDINRGDINRGDINRGDNIVNRPVDIRDVDINRGDINRPGYGWDNGYGCCYRPLAAAAVVGAAAVTGAAIASATIGSVVYTLPTSCTSTYVNGIWYEQCSDGWYQPQFEGTTTSYVVVNPP